MRVTVSRKQKTNGMPALWAVASKSVAHRLLMLSALAKKEGRTEVLCAETNDDIERTAACLSALGADILRTERGFSVRALDREAARGTQCEMNAGESGSTLRFLLPILGMLGVSADIKREGRLPKRPLAPLDGLLTEHGMHFTENMENEAVLEVRGALTQNGVPYTIPGGVSSQNITGLLMALALSEGEAELYIEGALSSAPYVDMTLDALGLCGVRYTVEETETGRVYRKTAGDICPPDVLTVEGDWSSAAAILCAGALSENGVTLRGLRTDSKQGDRAILSLLAAMGAQVRVDGDSITVLPPENGKLQPIICSAEHTPDLVPVLAVTCGAAYGKSVIRDCGRLRIKESDRLAATEALLLSLDVAAYTDGGELHIYGILENVKKKREVRGVHMPPAVPDHRMVMAAALGSLYARGKVGISCVESVDKSYPRFFTDMAAFCEITEKTEEDAQCQAPMETD